MKDTHYQVLMASNTVAELVEQIDKGDLLIAPFQRTYQWHNTDSPLVYLDSLTRNIFTMPVILVEHKKETWIIDGQQRLATLYCYVKGFVPKSDEIKWNALIKAIKNDDLSVVEPCQWEEWDDEVFDMDKIKQAPIGYSLLFNVNQQDNNELLVQIFDRINNQGIWLSLEDTIRAYAFVYNHLYDLVDFIDSNDVKYLSGSLHRLGVQQNIIKENDSTLSFIKILFDKNKYDKYKNIIKHICKIYSDIKNKCYDYVDDKYDDRIRDVVRQNNQCSYNDEVENIAYEYIDQIISHIIKDSLEKQAKNLGVDAFITKFDSLMHECKSDFYD